MRDDTVDRAVWIRTRYEYESMTRERKGYKTTSAKARSRSRYGMDSCTRHRRIRQAGSEH